MTNDMYKLFLSLLALCLCVGCDSRPQRVPVAGKVTIDGQPLTSGFVRFVPAHGRTASGELNANGEFKLSTFDDNDGALVGQHQVEIIAVANPTATKVRYLTPTKYQDANTSGVQFNITKPEPNLVIELSWNGETPLEETRINEGDVPVIAPSTSAE